MASGSCVGWKEENGYGFIRPDAGGADIFVHRRDIANAAALAQGWRVSYEVGMDQQRGRPRAEKVRVL